MNKGEEQLLSAEIFTSPSNHSPFQKQDKKKIKLWIFIALSCNNMEHANVSMSPIVCIYQGVPILWSP